MKHLILLLSLFVGILNISCTETIYVEILPEAATVTTISVYRWSVTHIDGTPYINAEGKITNKGTRNIKNIRVLISSNYGDTRMTRPSPGSLIVDEIGNWLVSGVPGTYIQSKAALFEEDD